MGDLFRVSGYPAHFCASDKLHWWLCGRVGDYVISSIGDYRPDGPNFSMEPIRGRGTGKEPAAFFETMVFRARGDEFEIDAGQVLDSDAYEWSHEATAGHEAMVSRWSTKVYRKLWAARRARERKEVA